MAKKITLLACPWVFQGDPEFQSQQLGLAYVGAYVVECGHKVIKYIDPMLSGGQHIKQPIATEHQTLYRVGHPDEWIISNIPDDSDYIFINAPFTDSRFVFYPLCNKIKTKFPGIPIVAGGILATTLPHQILKETKIDIVVKGEGEIAGARILNGEPLASIPGLVFRDEQGHIHENPERSEQLLNIDQIPRITQFNMRPVREYVNWSPRGNTLDKTFSYITSRGCPFTCEFCSIPEKGQTWRAFSATRVIEEIQFMIDHHDVTHIEIEDDNFTLKKEHAIPILNYLKKLKDAGHPVKLSFPNGVMINRLDREQIFAMKAAGTEIIYLPVESGDLKNLIAMNKPFATRHLDQTLQVAHWCAEAQLDAGAFFIIGYPGGKICTKPAQEIINKKYPDSIIKSADSCLWIKGEDEASFDTTISYAKKLVQAGVKFITPLIATPYPGTNLYEICKDLGWLRKPDHANMVTTISYQNPKVDYINIETPWCSAAEAFSRWKYMSEIFDIKHNVIKTNRENDTP
ncbi:MAG: B12-binding domain-containing radical SAM protein [Deltaproteobacteria bacterium]|nr:B12-binding domain-containing radical SAM protein [Deltaproteobacteria bacterium]